MSCTSPHTIRGWFTDIQSWRGRDGTHILESGLAAPISRSELASESVGGGASDGDGVIGGSTGITITQFTTMAGITPGAGPFTIVAVSPEGQASGAALITVPGQLGLSREIERRHGDTLRLAVRAAYILAPSAA